MTVFGVHTGVVVHSGVMGTVVQSSGWTIGEAETSEAVRAAATATAEEKRIARIRVDDTEN